MGLLEPPPCNQPFSSSYYVNVIYTACPPTVSGFSTTNPTVINKIKLYSIVVSAAVSLNCVCVEIYIIIIIIIKHLS
jgi:hypothetical protein